MRVPRSAVAMLATLPLLGCAPGGNAPGTAAFNDFPADCLYRADFGQRSVSTSSIPQVPPSAGRRAVAQSQTEALSAECICRQDGPIPRAAIEADIRDVLARRAFSSPSGSGRVTEARRGTTAQGHDLVTLSVTGTPAGFAAPGPYFMEVNYIIAGRCVQSFSAIEAGALSARSRAFLSSITVPAAQTAVAPPRTASGERGAEARLDELAHLRARGLITQREYEDARQRIISGL